MGEVADDMICGLSCSHCGVYFEKEHGFPVLCHDCFEDDLMDNDTVPDDVIYAQATHKEL